MNLFALIISTCLLSATMSGISYGTNYNICIYSFWYVKKLLGKCSNFKFVNVTAVQRVSIGGVFTLWRCLISPCAMEETMFCPCYRETYGQPEQLFRVNKQPHLPISTYKADIPCTTLGNLNDTPVIAVMVAHWLTN